MKNLTQLTLPFYKANFGENLPRWLNQFALITSIVAILNTQKAQHDLFFFLHKNVRVLYMFKPWAQGIDWSQKVGFWATDFFSCFFYSINILGDKRGPVSVSCLLS